MSSTARPSIDPSPGAIPVLLVRLALLVLPVLLAGAGPAAAQQETAAAPPDLLLRNVSLIDGTGAEPLEGVSVRVREGRIAEISPSPLQPEAGEEVLDLDGRWLLPGLIDAHVHVSSIDQARRALASGVTTVRSAGSDHYVDVGLRELKDAGFADIPEVVAAGYHVRPEPAEGLFLDDPELGRLRETGVETPEQIRTMVAAMAEHGIDFVKVNATARAGLPQTDPREPYYDETQLTALVEAAGAGGLPVMAHAHGDEGGRAAVAAGVRSIEHGTYLSDETLRLMAERGTYLVPTVAVVEDLTRPGGDYDVPFLQVRGLHMLPRIRQTARRAHELGVPIVAATDTGYGPDGVLRLGHELLELVESVGMTPMEAIRAATSGAATLLGVDDHTGTVAEGMDADLIVVDRSPLDDIRYLQDVLVVVNDGRVSVNRIQW